MGVSKTQVVKFIRKGDKGDKGEQGAVLRGPQAWSDCAMGYAFQAGGVGEKWQDVVIYGDNYYSCKKSHTKTASNYPGSTTAINNGYWQLGDKIELVATKILLATYALVKNLGVEAIDMKDVNGNILFQAKDGNVTCKTGTFENIRVSGNSKIGGFTIDSGRLDWKSRDFFGQDSRSLKLGMSEKENEGVVDISFDGATTGKFGVKVAGCKLGGSAAIYASGSSPSPTYPNTLGCYAGYFDGFVHVNGTLVCDNILTKGCGTDWALSNKGYTYTKGVNWNKEVGSPDLDNIRLIVKNGLIIGCYKE